MGNVHIEKYLRYLKDVQGYSEKTYISYAHDLSRLEGYLTSHNMNVESFTAEDARIFTADLYEQKLAPSTINRILSSNRSFFHNLCENGVIENQPFLRISRAKMPRKLPTVLSDDEIKSILNYKYQNYTELTDVVMFNLFYSTGCRLSEILGMKIQDVNLPERRIIVFGKGSKQRFVFLSQRAADILKEYIVKRAELLKKLKIKSDILLLNKKGKQLPLSSVHSIFDKYRVKLGITKKFTPHVFRHTFATRLLDNNSDIRIVQAMLGHESIGTTQIYTHVSGARLEKVYKEAHPHSRRKEK